MTSFRTRNRTPRAQANFERRERWSRTRLMATTGLGGALAGLALGGGNAWGQVGNNTLPSGGQVVAGSATINQQGANTLNINQSTNRAVINWSSFDVGKDATVNFYQPDSGSWTVNRVSAGQSASQILGSVNANGNIVVINPNGVIFGAGSRVDVNGLIATTSNISNQNFMSGNMNFDQPGNPTGMIVNQGDITVRDAGLVAFVAPGVSNSGTITANLGRVSLASGNKFTVDLYGDKLVSIAIDGGTTARPVDANGNPVDALVSNSGQILAAGGRVQMTAQQASAIVDNAINMSGVVRAQSAYVDRNGDIVLDAGPSGNVVVSGTLDVSGQQAGTTGGSVTVTGKSDVILTGTAKVDASGKAGGGSVKIGGDYKGQGTTPTAKRTLVATGAQINASAIDSGNGGRVIVWSDEHTLFGGAIEARGGAISGNGGFIETSGAILQIAESAAIDATALNGTAGTWLLDPRDLTIANGGGGIDVVNATFGTNSNTDQSIGVNKITTVLNAGNNVVLQANNDIILNTTLTVNNGGGDGGDLTLQAGRSILLQGNNITTDNGDLTLIANESLANGVVDASRLAGAAVVTGTGTINAGTGVVTVTLQAGTDKTNDASGNISLGQITAGGITITDSGTSTGNTISNTGTWTSTGGISVTSLNSLISTGGTITAATGVVLDAGTNAVINNNVFSTAGTINIQANNDITIASALSAAAGNANLVLQAGRDINVNANITSRGSITATVNDTTQDGTKRADGSAGDFVMGAATALSTTVNNGSITINVDTTDNATFTPGNVTLRTITAGGTGNFTVNANTAGTQINVNNTITANQVTLTGRRIDLGANIAQSGSITNAAGVPVVVNVLNNTADLDDSMDLVTAGGSTISVAAGTYARSSGWVIDVDGVIVRGAQAGVDGNTGGRTFASGAETILDMNNSTGAVIQASNVTFDGFSIRMSSGSTGHAIFINDNVLPIASPSILNNIISSPTTYQQYGITNNGSINGISGTTSIVGNRVLNYGATLGADGVFINNADDVVISSLYVAGATGSNRGVLVSNSGNVTLSNVTVAGTGAAGVSIANSTSAAISNLIVPAGASITGRAVAIADTPTTISGATIAGTVGGQGIHISGGSAALISNATIGPVGGDGIIIQDVGGSSSIANATITGAGEDGIEVRSNTANVLVALQNVSISGAGVSGIRVRTVAANTAQITLLSGVVINHGANTGIIVDGAGAGFSNDSLGSTVFISNGIANAASKYVVLANGAETGNIINGLSASYDGTIGSAVADATTGGQIEAKFTDDDTAVTLGNIIGSAFTTVNGGGLAAIQAALDVYDALNAPGTVVVLSGTYATGGGTNQLVFNEDGVVMRVDTGAVVNLNFDAGAAIGDAIVINAADITINGGPGTLNIAANSNYTNVIHVFGASAGGNLVLNDFNIGNLGTNFTGHGIFIDSPGVNGNRTMTLINIAGSANAGMGIFVDPTAGNTTISGGSISGMAVGIAVDDHTGSLVVDNNTINTISGHAITINNVKDGTGLGFGAGNVQVNNNVIASTGTIQGNGISVTTVVGNVVAQNNVIGVGSSLYGGGIFVSNVTGAASGVTVSGGTIANFGTNLSGDGIQIDTVLGATSQVVVNSIVIDGNSNPFAQDGISLVDVRSATVSNATVSDTTYGVFIIDNTDPTVATNTTLAGVTVNNVGVNGIEFNDSGPAATSTLFFGAGNVVNGAVRGVLIDGVATRIGNASTVGFNNLVLTNISGNFIELSDNAVFAPGNPTVVRAHDVHFDVNNNGTIDAGERGADYVVPTNQAQLDAIFAGYGAIEDRIVHNLDDSTLGLIQILPNAFVLTNTTGGLNAIQTAVNALGSIGTGSTGAVFVGAGTWGAPEPTIGTDNAITITNSGAGNVLLYGTQAFTAVPGSSRLPTAGTETILDFTDPAFGGGPLVGGVDIRRTNTSVSGFSMQLGADQGFGVRITNTASTAFTGINVNNNFIIGNWDGSVGNLAGPAVEVNPTGVGQVRNITVSGNSIANIDGGGIYVEMNAVGGGAQRSAVLSNNIMDSVGQAGAEGITLIAGTPSVLATVSTNTITNVGGGGISLTDVTNYTVNSNVIDFAQGSGIAVAGGGSGFTSISQNRVGTSTVAGNTIAGNGIDVQSSQGALNISNNTVGNGGTAAVVGSDGIYVLNSGSTVLLDNTIRGTLGDGIQIEWGQATAANVTIRGQSINNVGGNGIFVLENGTGTITTTFAAGTAMPDTNISGVSSSLNAGLVFDGDGTRVGGNVLQNLNFLGAFPGQYILLRNNALFNPGNPTQITASAVGFDFNTNNTIDVGERGADYSTAGVTDYLTQAERLLWGNAEQRITHYIDDQTLGFIRLLDTAIVVADPLAGLSSIQRAINLSAPTIATHTVYVNPGSYGDPSTAQGGLDVLTIPYSLNFLGWNDGVSAVSGGRTVGNAATESILNFAGATVPTRGLLIQGNGVVVDGLDFAFDNNQSFGIRIDDSTVARSNISIVNNFIRGTVTNLAGDGIGNVGTQSVTGVTITGNNIDSIGNLSTYDAVDLVNVTGLILQNNLVGTAAAGTGTVFGHGFNVRNTTYATSVSGNSIYDTGLDGIHLDNAGLAAGGATNFVSVVNNTLDNIGENGISANGFRTIAVVTNTIGSSLTGVGDSGVTISNTTETVTVTGNTISNVGSDNAGTTAFGIGVTLTAGTGLAAGATAVSIAGNSISANNAVTQGEGIFVGGTANGDVRVISNFVANIATNNGILVLDSGDNVYVTSNSINIANEDGIQVRQTDGAVTVDLNSVHSSGDDGISIVDTGLTVDVLSNSVSLAGFVWFDGDGIVVTRTGTLGPNGNLNGTVRVLGNVVQNVTGDGTADGDDGLSGGDGIRVSSVDGNVVVGNDGNTVFHVGDDGIEINGVVGSVTSWNNTIANTSTVTNTGDGIVITNIGNAYFGGGVPNAVVTVSNNTIAAVNGIGAIDTLTDGLSGGDGIRISDVDGRIVVGGNRIGYDIVVGANTFGGIGNDGIQAYNINQTSVITGNLLTAISDDSDTGDGIVVENTGKYAASLGNAQGGSVTIDSNSISNVLGGANPDTDTITTASGRTTGLTSGDGIRVGGIDGDVQIGAAGTGNSIQDVNGDGIQVYFVTGQNGTSIGNGVRVGSNFILSVGGGGGGDLDGDGIQISRTGFYGGASANFTGDVFVSNNIVNDVQADLPVDRDDGFTSGDGIRIVQADGNASVSNNFVGAGTSVGEIDNDGIQIHTVTRQVTVASNTVGSAGGTIGTGGGAAHGDGIVIESTGTLSGAAHAVAGAGSVLVQNNIVQNVVGDGSDDTDDATVPVTGLDSSLTSGDGIRVGFADGTVSVASNSVANVGDDGIQVFAVTGNGGTVTAPSVVVTLNTVSLASAIGTGGDGIVVSFTGAFVTNPTGTVTTGLGAVAITNNTVNDVRGTAIDDDDDRTAGDGIRVRSADGTVLVDANNIANVSLGHIANDGIQVWDVTRSVTVTSNNVGSANASIGVATPNGDGIVVENTGFYSSFGGLGASLGDPALNFGGSVVVSSNNVRNVVGPADVETNDGYNPASGAGSSLPTVGAENDPNDFLSSGDGIRVAYIDGRATLESNAVTNTAGDGIQGYYIAGTNVNGLDVTVILTNNVVTSVGNGAGGDGDGIVVSFTGGYGLGIAPTVGSNTNDGGVLIQGNIVNGVIGNGVDRDDGRSAGDGIRVRSADGTVQIQNNTIANSGTIANDGIQVWDATRNVTALNNTVGSAGFAVGTGASADGDGIVIENTGTVTTGGASFSSAGAGSVVVQNNLIQNVLGTAADDADGALTAVGATEQFASAGDGIRVAFADGDVLINNNRVLNVGDDGIQVLSVTGNGTNGNTTTLAGVTISNNIVTSVGNGSGLGDGIVVSYTGRGDASVGSAAGSGGVLILNNVVNVVSGNGTDDDDGFTAGDGVRVVRVDGHVTAQGNTIGAASGTVAAAGNIANDGIQISHVGRTVRVLSNIVGSAGASIGTGASGDGDGIVVENTGTLASTLYGVSQGGATTVQSNSIMNVFGGTATDLDSGYTSGDGIRTAHIDGPLLITANAISIVGDDGIQADNISGSVTVTTNTVNTVGNVAPNDGDGVVISDVGLLFTGIGPSGVMVIVDNNVIDNVNGDGLADPDHGDFSNGDGIRVVRVDGSVQTNANSITNVDDDGIYIGLITGGVNVRNNFLNTIGRDSATGDGIVVSHTGTFGGSSVGGGGGVTILNNTVSNVNANAPATPDFDDPEDFFGGKNVALSSGDGIRAEYVDGNVFVGDGSTTGNSILNVDDDGIQIDSVRGNVTALFNRIESVGVDGNKGDGIIVANVGNAYAINNFFTFSNGGGPSGVVVNVSNNTITSVNGDGLADPDDSRHSAGDGVRVIYVDGSVTAGTNTITSVDDDGIYVGVVRNTVSVLNNRLNSIGLGSATGDGIVVAVTGEYAGGTADGGDVTINGNSIANVDAGTPGSSDFDDPNTINGSTGSDLTSGDGIRASHIDGDVVIGLSSATGNSIQSVDDDGIQAYSVTGATTIAFNTIANVGNDGTPSLSADGIQVNLTGSYALNSLGVTGAGDVVVLSNHITNVQNTQVPALDDPEDLQSAGDGIRLHDISGDATASNNVIDPIADDGIQMGNIDFTVNANNNTITDVGFTSVTGDGIIIFNTGIVGANDGNGSVTVSGNTITNVAVNSGGTGAADPDDGGFTSNDGIRIVTVDGGIVVANNRITSTQDDGIQASNIQRSTSITGNVINSVGAGSNEGDGILVAFTGQRAAPGAPLGAGDVVISGNTVTSVTGNGGADNDDLSTAGDGVRVRNIDGDANIANNVIQNVGDDGIQALVVDDSVSITGNRISLAGVTSTTGDGIAVERVGTANTDVIVVSGNTVINVNGDGAGNVDNAASGTTENDGIRIASTTVGSATVDANVVTDVGDDGIEVVIITGTGNVFVTNNTLNSIGTGTGGLGDGILVSKVAGGGATVTGNTVNNVLSANAGNADTVDNYSAGDGIRVTSIQTNVLVSTNTVGNAADDGIQIGFVAGTVNALSNRINSVSNVSSTGDGIHINLGSGNTTVSGNVISDVNGDGTADPDVNGMSAGDGIRVDSLTGDLVISGNTITDVGDDGVQVDFNLGNVTVSNNRIDQFGVLSGGSGDGVMVMDTTGSVVANGNVISNGNGVLTDIDDATFNAGDGIRIVRTSGNAEASNNSVSSVDDDGIQIEITGGTAVANGNSLTGVGSDGIEIITTTGAVTASANVLTNNGTSDGTDVGILLIDFASAVVTNNTIVNVTPGSLEIGIDIGNMAGPAALITMTGNSISDSNTGLFIRDNVMGTVTGNTFTNNVVWGVQIDNGVSGNGIGQGLSGDVVPTLDIWFRDNFIAGNGAPVPGDGVTRGGVNNLRPGPAVGGFIFDARGNNFNGQVPFTTGTHFENPNTGGGGDAVSDWVRIDALVIINPIIPYYDFGSLLDNLARGGEAKTPGDVLAIGPYFNENGDLFDPYFVDVFGTAFGLAGEGQTTGDANQYAMCTLADMWKVSSCRKAPPK